MSSIYMIDPDIVAKLKLKYGNKIMKVLNLYGYGIPEQHWFKEPEPGNVDFENHCISLLEQGYNICIVGNKAKQINEIIAEIAMSMITNKKFGTKYVDYVTLMGQLVDKYGLMQTNVTKEWKDCEIIAITNIRNYGRKFEQLQGIFNSVIDSSLNQIFKKQFILGLELFDDTPHKPKLDTDGSTDENEEIIWNIENGGQPETDSETLIYENFTEIYRLIKNNFIIVKIENSTNDENS